VVLINSLRYKYLYEYDKATYGNDCASNKAAKITLRTAQLGALAYLIGDVQANIKFKKASQKATDELKFIAKSKDEVYEQGSKAYEQAKEKAKEEDKEDPRLEAL